MRILTMEIRNFRGYKEAVTVDFGNFTAFVGKNDVGKSTILEALDIFFNDGKGAIKMDANDVNVDLAKDNDQETSITVVFSDMPSKIVIDATNETSLQDEYMLNSSEMLEVTKRYSKAGKAKVFIKAYHPTNPKCADLLLKKSAELTKIIESLNIPCENKNVNSLKRSAIWKHFEDDLMLEEVYIDVTKEGAKEIWTKLEDYMPSYSLFQSDRKNTDGDSEVQNPLKVAVNQILKEENLLEQLRSIAEKVNDKLREVSVRTLEKLREVAPDVANDLQPNIQDASQLNWGDVFKKVCIEDGEHIPVNKRGSGVKRLILISFFRAEAERLMREQNKNNIIYAIEEPETSQHNNFQRVLIKSLKDIAQSSKCQIIITTHSATVVKQLQYDDLRIILKEEKNITIKRAKKAMLSFASLNEVNFAAFDEVSEGYHDELYGEIECQGKMNDFEALYDKNILYTKVYPPKNGVSKESPPKNISLTEYIRHQIHHPENQKNPHFTPADLVTSIERMRNYLAGLYATPND